VSLTIQRNLRAGKFDQNDTLVCFFPRANRDCLGWESLDATIQHYIDSHSMSKRRTENVVRIRCTCTSSGRPPLAACQHSQDIYQVINPDTERGMLYRLLSGESQASGRLQPSPRQPPTYYTGAVTRSRHTVRGWIKGAADHNSITEKRRMPSTTEERPSGNDNFPRDKKSG